VGRILMETLIERVLPLAGVHNFRDYGGYAARGGRLRAGRLYRSAQHRDATDADLVRIDALDLAAVVDLRGESERRAAPCRRGPRFQARVVFVADETSGLAPHLEAARTIDTSEEARAVMRASYAGMPFRPKLLEILRLYFEALETAEGPVLVHCLAGKDRTGVAVALFHAMMGVHADDIAADYLLTNTAGNIEARIESGGKVIRANFGQHLSDAAVRALMSVEQSYLDAAFGAIIERHGGIDAYLAEQLGVTPQRRDRIVGALLA